MNLTTEQMQAILKGAPSGAEFGIKRPDYDFAYYKQGQENYAMTWAPSGYWFESVLSNEYLLENAELIKLSDIRAELDSRYKAESKQRVDELNKSADEAIAALDTFNTAPRLSKTIDKSVCLSNIAENDTQSDFKTKVKTLALENGFKLKEQLDGSFDLNPYVYEFAAALIEQEQSVIERVKLLKKFVDELDSNDTMQSSLLSSVDWQINKLFPELKEVAGDE